MSFPYKHVLMIGATSGIGKGMADHLASSGVKVTAVGRRKDRLEEFVQKHGSGVAAAAPFDITNLDHISGFAEEYASLLTFPPPTISRFCFLSNSLSHTHNKPGEQDADANLCI